MKKLLKLATMFLKRAQATCAKCGEFYQYASGDESWECTACRKEREIFQGIFGPTKKVEPASGGPSTTELGTILASLFKNKDSSMISKGG